MSDVGFCQNCGKVFDLKSCNTSLISGCYKYDGIEIPNTTLVCICPHCKHGNYDDNIKGEFAILKGDLE